MQKKKEFYMQKEYIKSKTVNSAKWLLKWNDNYLISGEITFGRSLGKFASNFLIYNIHKLYSNHLLLSKCWYDYSNKFPRSPYLG